MKLEDVKAIVDREFEPMKRRLGIDIPVLVAYEATGDGPSDGYETKATCNRMPNHDKARVTLYYETLRDEAGIGECLLHELLHIVMKPFCAFGTHVLKGASKNPVFQVFSRLRQHTDEKLVCNLLAFYRSVKDAPGINQPIDKGDIDAFIGKQIGPMSRSFGVDGYRLRWYCDMEGKPIDWHYGKDNRSRCRVSLDYERADLHFHPDAFTDEASLLEALRHELFRIVIAPYHLFAELAVEAFEGEAKEIIKESRLHFEERLLANLERMYQGLVANSQHAAPTSDSPPYIQ